MSTSVKAGFVAYGLGLATLVASGMGIVSCAKKQEVRSPESSTIFLGDSRFVEIDGNYSMRVKYSGMTGDNQRFLLASSLNWAVNTYYPVQNGQINFGGNRFKVNFVTPDSIGLTYAGKTDKK